jgi:hypothetical protein
LQGFVTVSAAALMTGVGQQTTDVTGNLSQPWLRLNPTLKDCLRWTNSGE